MRKILFVILLSMTVSAGYGFNDPINPPPPDAPPPPPPGLPIDTALPFLLAAGLGLGIVFLNRKKA